LALYSQVVAMTSIFASLCFLWTAEASFSLHLIPINLRILGLKLFKNEMKLCEVISNMSKPVKFNVTGVPFVLVENRYDMSLHKLKYEVFGIGSNLDGYDLKRIGAIKYGTMIDIGANIGSISIYIAKKCPTWRFISFEPAHVTYF
jgi:hypothetical protein